MIQAQDSTVAALRPREDGQAAASPEAPSPSKHSAEPAEIVIRPRSGWIPINWRELYAYRELLFFFVWRDIMARYKQTVLGSAWAVIQPLLLMVIFTFVARVVQIKPPEVNGKPLPYPVFVFAGLIPWTIFSQGMAQSALSLINNYHMMTKVYFPRLFLPVAAAAVFLVDMVYSLGIYALILLVYGYVPAWTSIFVPVLVVLTLAATLSFGILLSSLTLFFRDFRHVVPFLVQIMMYVSPVFYSSSNFKNGPFVWALSLNPMFGIIEAYRAAILGAPLNVASLLISATVAVVLFTFSLCYFARTERRFADYA